MNCVVCGQPTTLECSRCRREVYCSVEHQRQHYDAEHREQCPQLAARIPKAFASSRRLSTILRYFKYKEYVQPMRPSIQADLLLTMRETCRYKIAVGYAKETMQDASIIFAFVHKTDWPNVDRKVTFFDSFLVLRYGEEKTAYLSLVCSRQLYVNDVQLKMQLGLILHAFAIRHLIDRGFTRMNLHADDQLVPYYEWLGYELTKQRTFLGVLLDYFWPDRLRNVISTPSGYEMHLDNIDANRVITFADKAIRIASEQLIEHVKTASDTEQLLSTA